MSRFARVLLLVALCALSSHVEGQRNRNNERRQPARPRQRRERMVFYNTPYPYACKLNSSDSNILCTAVLVNSSWVITSASCVDEAVPSDLVIYCDGSEDRHRAEEIVVHEEWLGIERLQYDLAMVKLRREVDLPPVELADSTENITNGHFHVIETDQEDVEYQQHTEATYMNYSMCNSRFFWTRSIKRDVVCASTEYGRCISDRGAALFFVPHYDSKPNVLYGVASFETTQCARHEFPVVYTSIPRYLGWIEGVINGTITSSPFSESGRNGRRNRNVRRGDLVELAVEAIEEDDSATLSNLLARGLAVDATVDDQKRSLLHLCAQRNAHKCAEVLVEYGANVSILEDEMSATPLHFAASSGSIPVAKVLVEAGAYTNAVDDFHSTPLHYVVTTDSGKLIMLLFLLEWGANVHEVDNSDATPLHYTAQSNWVSATKVLVRAAGSNLVAYAYDEGTPLHWAARAGASDTVRVLIEAGIDIEIVPKTGPKETALLFAVRNRAPLLTIRLLVRRGGANVNVADGKGQTPLHRAAKNGDVDVIEFLLKNGANTRARNSFEKRPVDVYCDFYDCEENADTRKLLRP